jgi:hypothetical protein
MILYKRTIAGSKVLLDPISKLPSKLKSLLTAIDGRTSRDTYLHSLSSLGDVQSLLDLLELQGFISSISARNTSLGTQSRTTSQAATNVQVTENQDKSSLPLSLTDNAFASIGNANSGFTLGQASPGFGVQPNPITPAPVRPGDDAPLNSESYQLRIAISLMSDFISSYLPDDALEILLALEGLGSVEQAIASLKGYRVMIAPAGDVVNHHMVELNTLLKCH